MIRTFGRLAATLVVGLGVAAAFAATTSATAPAQSAALGALDSSRTQDAETSSKGRAVADWSLIAQNAIVVAGKRFPGEAAVYMGIVHAAIYDVVVAIEGGYRPYAITPTVPPNTSVDAAVATAAHRVLVGRFPDQQPPGGLDDVYFAYLDGIPDGEAKTNGILVGEEVGVGMLLLRANDGLDAACPTSSDHRGRESMNRPHRRRRLEHGCRACCRWPWSTRPNSGQTALLHYAAWNTRETSTK